MSLDNPSTVEKFIEQWKAFKYKNILLYAIIGLVAIGLVLYVVDYVSTVIHDRQRTKLQANINAATAELANIKANTLIDREKEREAVANAQKALSEYQQSQAVTDNAKVVTNQALANLANSNKNTVNITAQDLERKLSEIP